tara:strand:- start:509 stop:721 length:213 start_codon:yes stop_codon:yes gene_type:complete
METMNAEEMQEEKMEEIDLPAGIKTDTVLKYLGDLSGALSSIANDINQTIVNVISAGTENNMENNSDDKD